MKAITLKEPFASLVACGAKLIETRDWSTDYRGPLAIVAGKSEYVGTAVDLHRRFPLAIPASVLTPVRGAVVCVAQLVDCVPTEELRERITPLERSCGFYEDGRFGLVLEDVRALGRPLPMRGWMRLWTLSREQRAAIEAEL